ncbi:MAG: ABC transporter permease [Armatimonadota bacterium]
MGRYLAQRLLFMLLVLFGSLVLVFVLSYAIPGDPARAALGEFASEQAIENYRRDLGLDRPLMVQLGLYLGRVARGNFGVSINSGRPVARDLLELLPATLELVIPSLILSTVLGVILGLISAVRAGRPADHVSRVTAVFGHSVPVFWLGIVLQLVFFGWLGWLPAGRRLPPGAITPPTVTGFYTVDSLLAGQFNTFWVALQHLVLPVVTLMTLNLAILARLTRASMLDVLRADYIRTAWSKGLPERNVVYKHALRNSLIPVVTVLGIRIGAALGGAVITETVFSWPGMGRYAVNALRTLDYPVVVGFTLMTTAGYAVASLLVDLSYVLIDPRIKYDVS